MRRADALIPLLDAHGHADAVADAKAAPRAADAALDGAQGLGVGVPALHAAVAEPPPDVDEVLPLGPEHVDALPARDLGVQVVLLGDLADDDEVLGQDLAGRDPRHDRVGAVALDVAEVPVVGLLQAVQRPAHDVLVPQRGEDAADGGLAGLAALRPGVVAGLAHHLGQRREPLHHDDVVEVRARVVEVGADVVLDLGAEVPHRLVEDARDERHAAAAAGAGLGARLGLADGLAPALLGRLDDVALADVVARADLRVVVEVVVVALSVAVLPRAQDELRRRHLELLLALHHGHELDVVARVPNHHAAEEKPAVGREEVLLVHVRERVLVHERLDLRRGTLPRRAAAAAARRRLPRRRRRRLGGQGAGPVAVGEEVPEAGHVDAEELQLRAQVRPLEGPGLVQPGLREVEGEDVGHLDAGGDEAEGLALPARALAYGVDVRDVRRQVIVDEDAAASLGAPDARPAGKFVAGSHAYREADGRARHLLAVLEDHARDVVVALPVRGDPRDPLRQHDVDAQLHYFLDDEVPGRGVELPAQQPAVPLDQLYLVVAFQVVHGGRRLETQQPAADHGAHRPPTDRAEVDEPLQVIYSAVHEDAVRVVARRVSRQHGVRARGEHQDVVRHDLAARARHRLACRVDLRDQGVEVIVELVLYGVAGVLRCSLCQRLSVWVMYYINFFLKVTRSSRAYPLSRIQVQVLDLAVLEEAGQADAVVREVRLVAYDHDVVLACSCV